MSRKLLLCVDDRLDSVQARKLLLEHEGYAVLTATHGIAGLELFASRAVDLVLLGYNMPGLNGAVLAQRMRALKPEVPLIMLSGRLVPPAEAAGLIDAYISKGQNPCVLLNQIDQLLSLTAHSGGRNA